MRRLKIGLLGCGSVGGGFVRLLAANAALVAARAEAELEVTRILVRDTAKCRPGVDPAILTSRARDVVENGVDLVVELIGGIDPARDLIRRSLWSGKHVVTANKAVLALAGDDLAELAAVHRVRLGFEASVCGAIPIVRVIRDGLAGDRVLEIEGVVNGTSNWILSRLEEGAPFDDALSDAQARGFAEADPSADVDGIDAAQKIAILARLAFPGRPLRWRRREGIRGVSADTIREAAARGETIRHVARCRERDGAVEADVGIERLAPDHPLARVRNEGNGIVLRTEAAGDLTFYGAGAGSFPTASSVLADVVEIARRK
ncbi:MAG: homoserine dehydrogenase [Thermoanaerobaculia bacterium]